MLKVNPMELIGMIKNGQNPQQLMLSVLQQNAKENPFMSNLLTMAQSNNSQQIEQVARNMFQSQGRDFDKEFNSFRKMTGL